MALTSTDSIDQITVSENGTVLARQVTKINQDGIEIAKKYLRFTFLPGDDISSMPTNVQAIAKAAWTPEVITAYQASKTEQTPI